MVILGGGGVLMSEVPLYWSTCTVHSFSWRRAWSAALQEEGPLCIYEGHEEVSKVLRDSGQDHVRRSLSWGRTTLQGYLAQKKQAIPLGLPQGPGHIPTVGS